MAKAAAEEQAADLKQKWNEQEKALKETFEVKMKANLEDIQANMHGAVEKAVEFQEAPAPA